MVALATMHFVPPTCVPPALLRAAPMALPAITTLGAAPVFADEIGDVAKQLSSAAYPFLKDVDWNSGLALTKPGSASVADFTNAIGKAIDMGVAMDSKLFKAGVEAHHKVVGRVNNGVTSEANFEAINAALGRMIASVPESKVMDVYKAFSKLVSPYVTKYLMGTVKEADAHAAYAALMNFTDVVKSHPTTASSAASSVSGAGISDVAKKLSDVAYPLLKDIDWSSDLALQNPGSVGAQQVLNAIDKALVMGASMDGWALKEASHTHVKAIRSMDAKGVTTQADFEAINAGLGKAIGLVPTSKVMDVYNAFSGVVSQDIPKYLMSSVKAEDAKAAYSASMEFKDVVKAAR